MGRESAIVCKDLRKSFGVVTALDGVDLDVPAGSVLGVLGPNGAGKTTMVRILATLVRPDSGRALIEGLDVVRDARAVRRRIGLAGQYAAVDAYLTGQENLVMIGCLAGLPRRAAHQRAGELMERFDLTGAATRQAHTYSGGMRRRLDLAASLVTTPPVLFLDEPTSGLDPHGRAALWDTLEELTAQGTTLLLTTQYMEEADHLATTIVIIDAGKVIANGTPVELKALVGDDQLELVPGPGDDPPLLAAALEGLGTAPPTIDPETRRVCLPINDSPATLLELAGRLGAAGVSVEDLKLRRPTLDDVFLTLTADRQEPRPSQLNPVDGGALPSLRS